MQKQNLPGNAQRVELRKKGKFLYGLVSPCWKPPTTYSFDLPTCKKHGHVIEIKINKSTVTRDLRSWIGSVTLSKIMTCNEANFTICYWYKQELWSYTISLTLEQNYIECNDVI